MDGNFVAPHIIDYVFYSFFLNNQLTFVYPYYPDQKYQINELPVSIRGTSAMMLSKGLANSIFCETKSVIIPYDTPEINYIQKKINIQIDNLKDTTFLTNSNTTLSGVYSTFYRDSNNEDIEKEKFDFYNELIAEKEFKTTSISIENINNSYPYNYVLKATHDMPLHFNQIDEKVYNLKLSDLFYISSLYSTNKKRNLDYYTRFLYNDISLITLSFKDKMTAENIDNLQKLSLTNNFGSVTLNVVQKEDKTISLYISYKINKLKLTPTEYHELIDLNEALDNILSQSITFTKEE